ncbi:hypothetical protein [Roseibium sp.]|uniref:hypothetical protein n=1 Tax=Roseibium sp. TaxID=1936156 RepID=UPI003B52C5B6
MTALEHLKARAKAVCACEAVFAATKHKWQVLASRARLIGKDASIIEELLFG